jgi:O-antigen ligase
MPQELIKELKPRAYLLYFLSFAVAFSICFVPYVPIKSGLSLRLEDFLLPLVLVAIAPSLKHVKEMYFVVLGLWGLWALISMAANGRLMALNDYFELYKLLKYASYAVFFWVFFLLKPPVFTWVASFFALAVLFNMLHYYNVFNFNEIVMPLYCPNPEQLKFFGRNSLGGPATKRILGTMGNPNVNALFFSFFMVYFMPYLRKSKWHFGKLMFFIAVAMLLFTQSRTGLLACVFVYICFIFIAKLSWKQVVSYSLVMLLVALLVFDADQYSMQYVTKAKWSMEENGSVRGRLEVWGELLKMVADQPFFGYGINKNYFYEHKLYSENEYILVLWRYGIPGLLFYGMMLFGLCFKYRDILIKRDSHESQTYLFLVLLLATNALTNNPMSNPMILVMFAMATGFFLSQTLPERRSFLQDIFFKRMLWK